MMRSESLDPKLQFALDPISSLHLIWSDLIQASLLITKLGWSMDQKKKRESLVGIRWWVLRAWIQNFSLLWIQLALFISSHLISSHLISSHASFSSYHEAWIDFRSWTRSWKNWAVIHFATFFFFWKKKKNGKFCPKKKCDSVSLFHNFLQKKIKLN
jgi:hypothetical protein